MEEAAEEYLGISAQPPEAMFDYLYAKLPSALADQRAAMLAAVPDRQPEQSDD